MNNKMLTNRQLLQIEDTDEFFEKARELFELRSAEVNRRYAENKLIVVKGNQWTIDLGSEPTFDEAFGPPSKAEIEANKVKPAGELMREYYERLNM